MNIFTTEQSKKNGLGAKNEMYLCIFSDIL